MLVKIVKILQINNYHFLKGGSERVYLETSKLLEERGHKVIHFSVNDGEALESPSKEYFIEPVDYFGNSYIKKIKSVCRFIFSKEAREKLEDLIRNEKPDVAHLHIFYGRLTSSILLVLKKFNIPVVMTVHGYRMLCPAYLFLDNKGKICEKCADGGYYHCILNRCNRGSLAYSSVAAFECYIRDMFFGYEKHMVKFIFVSRFIMDRHLHYKLSMRNKAVQIYNFINLEKFAPNYFTGDYYLYIGRLSREKGVMTLLEAWKQFPDAKLRIAGDGNLKKEILGYIKRHNIDNVELVGYMAGQKLLEIVRNSKYVIAPSEWYETFGLSIAESFACGKPVIASRIGAIPELVKDKINGFLFESKSVDSLVAAVKSAESISEAGYMELSHEARRYAETYFNKEIYYSKLVDIYKEVSR